MTRPSSISQQEIDALAARLTRDQILVLPFFHEVANEVKQADRVRVQTEYFWRRWVPKLGPTLTVLVITLRGYCYYNRLTKERREWCFPEQDTLARDVGVSIDTIQRELKKETAQHFVRREARYRYDSEKRKKVRTADMYFVAMDDPIAEEDEGQLAIAAAERILQEQALRPTPQSAVQVGGQEPPKPQSAVQVGPPKPQIAVHRLATANCGSLNVTLNQILDNVLNVGRDRGRERKDLTEALVEDMLDALGDRHSLGFYRRVAERIPPEIIYRALSETKEEARVGRIRKTKGAFFTDLIKREAQEAGVGL
jgi:hypothetical protein